MMLKLEKDLSSKCYIKGARLKYYPPKFNIYRHSKGIKKPSKDKMEYRGTEKVDSINQPLRQLSSCG